VATARPISKPAGQQDVSCWDANPAEAGLANDYNRACLGWWKKGRRLKYSRLPDSGSQQCSGMMLVEKWVHFPSATA
jgi:hypothetical protein